MGGSWDVNWQNPQNAVSFPSELDIQMFDIGHSLFFNVKYALPGFLICEIS